MFRYAVLLCVLLGAVASLLLAGTSSGAEEGGRIELKNCPKAVQEVFIREAGSDKIENMEWGYREGKKVYAGSFTVKGKKYRMVVDEDGKVVSSKVIEEKKEEPRKDEPKKEDVGKGGATKLADCPKTVQEVFRRESGGADVTGMEWWVKEGKKLYAGSFTVKGKKYRMVVDEDGKVISSKVIEEKKEEPKKEEPKNEEAGKGGATKLEDCPKAVQEVFKREAGSDKIENMEWGYREGKKVYAGSFTVKGMKYRMVVDEDGKVISNKVIEEKKDEPKKEEPVKAGPVKLEDCPEAVQKLFRREAGEGGKVVDIEKGEREGKVVYAATLVCKEKSYRIVVTAEGKVISCKEIEKK